VPAIAAHIVAERGDLVHHPVPVDDADGAVLDPHGRGALEQPLNLLRPGRGGEIEVGVGVAQQGVPQGAAHAPGLVTGGFQHPGDLQHLLRHGHRVREAHGEP
jgi:hypothetical protein